MQLGTKTPEMARRPAHLESFVCAQGLVLQAVPVTLQQVSMPAVDHEMLEPSVVDAQRVLVVAATLLAGPKVIVWAACLNMKEMSLAEMAKFVLHVVLCMSIAPQMDLTASAWSHRKPSHDHRQCRDIPARPYLALLVSPQKLHCEQVPSLSTVHRKGRPALPALLDRQLGTLSV